MKRFLDLIQQHPAGFALGMVIAGIFFLVSMRLLRIRLGFPAVVFGCLFTILAGACSQSLLKSAARGILRWFALALMAGSVLLYIRYARAPQNRLTPVHWGWVVLLAFACCLIPTSTYLEFSALSLVAVSMMFVAAFGTIWYLSFDARRLMEIANTLFKLAAFVICLGFLFILIPGTPLIQQGRFRGFFDNPNWNGNFTAIVLPLLLWKNRYARTARERYITFFLVAASCANIVLSGSRGALMGTLIALPLAQYRLSKPKFFKRILLVVLLAGFLASLIFLTRDGRQFLVTHAKKFARIERIWTLTHRTEMWGQAWPAVVAHLPMGIGLGNSRFILVSEEAAEATSQDIGGVSAGHLHSQQVVMLAELGIIGFVLLWVFIFYMVATGMHLFQLSQTPLSDLGFVLFCSSLVVFADSFLHGWMLSAGSPYALLFWVLVAVCLKAERLARLSQITRRAPVSPMVNNRSRTQP